MNVLLIAQCRKRALTQTRRILDQFAERRGDCTWQTTITEQGLATLHRLLRSSARKNTAVACHWIRGKDHSELLWVVGDARQFNPRGATPTNVTRRDVLRAGDENDWHSAETIRLLARLAALLHDIGKANGHFQKKLRSRQPLIDAYRHEWLSLRLFEALVGDDDDAGWLQRLADTQQPLSAECLRRLRRDSATPPAGSPFSRLPPLARLVGWLIVSHHRLPTPGNDVALAPQLLARLPEEIVHHWCGSHGEQKNDAECWQFKYGLPFDSPSWRQRAARVASALRNHLPLSDSQAVAALLDNPYVLHVSRLALMLADHYYSAQPAVVVEGEPAAKLYANTRDNENGKKVLNQRLDDHLLGVERTASRVVRALPPLENGLPRLVHRGFRVRSRGEFRWQNAAFDLAESLQARSARQGFFGVNMASTGCGKTLANGRILYGLANPLRGARFTVALGLRTLTLQTGDAYRERLQLGAADLAVLVGSVASRRLHADPGGQGKAAMPAPESAAAHHGSESSEPLLPVDSAVHYDGRLQNGPLKDWLGKNSAAQRLLAAPILACTIDHLMPACESTRGGWQIAPMLRLLTADLVLDEADDFSIEDLPALSRLVYWAGLLGSRVLLSSATLPPALVQGLFLAYLAGRRVYQQNRGRPGEPLAVCCAWFDEFAVQGEDHHRGTDYLVAHQRFVDCRLRHLAKAGAPRRRAAIQALPIASGQPRDAVYAAFAGQVHAHMHALHATQHSVDPVSGKRVSFGLLRMANIDPLFDVAGELFRLGAAEGCRLHLCVYHSRHPLLVRAAIERTLDGTLKRHQPAAVFARPDIRQRLDGSAENDHLFVVLGTAVTEVGRDHDYDWAIVEPSSMRSIIQLAGRVRRHRPEACPPEQPNIYLLDCNIRHLLLGDRPAVFLRPGFEREGAQSGEAFRLCSHHLSELLTEEQYRCIDAAPRIRPRQPLQPQNNLADLEHQRLSDLMLGADVGQVQVQMPVHRWWTTRAPMIGALQRASRFRLDPLGRQSYALLPTDDDDIGFFQLDDGQPPLDQGLHPQGLARRIEVDFGPRVSPWAVPDYLQALQELAAALQLTLRQCAEIYGRLDLPPIAPRQWRYHWALGFSRHQA